MNRVKKFFDKKNLRYLFLLLIILGLFNKTYAQDLNLLDYESYLSKYSSTLTPDVEIYVEAETYISTESQIEIRENLKGAKKVIIVPEKGYVEWEVEVENSGLYNIAFKYYPVQGKGSNIEREIMINGQYPFEGAKYLTFHRVWKDAETIKRDNRGNELIPSQKEEPVWIEKALSDSFGSHIKPYRFYLKEGKNIIRLISRKEPMAIDYLKIFNYEEPKAYKEISREYEKKGYKSPKGVFVKLQERDVLYKSSPTLYPIFEKGDPKLEPYHPVLVSLNAIGGRNWNKAGDWISWEFEIPEDGLYMISIKGKQNFSRGRYVSRKILIDGKIPFAEMSSYAFSYSAVYRMYTLSPKEDKNPYLFYLSKGKHTITLEVSLGELVEIIRTVEKSLYELNTIYRKIIMITSPTPDPLRTYQLEKRIPGLIENLNEQGEIIKQVAEQLETYTGQKGGSTVLLVDLARQLKDLAKEPESIPGRLAGLRDNLGALGSWLLDVRGQPLVIDYIIIASPEQKLPRAEATFTERLKHEFKAFIASFSHNYKLVGDVYNPDDQTQEVKPLKVWIGIGRDEAQILKKMIENDFTPKTGIPVNLELVNMAELLPATLAGTGPDVALGVNPAQPINFAFRNAAHNLAGFSDFSQIAKRFKPSAFTPFKFRDKVYALPEQQPFPMMFYRKDILEEKDLMVPQTWDELLNIIPELQKDNMQVGLPFSVPLKMSTINVGQISASAGSLSSSGGVITFITFMYQSGKELILEDGLKTNLESESAVEAFTHWTELYELYDLPLMYDAANRFRMGEMPIIITGYPFYNLMTVFAPELRGKWDFTLIPGTVKPDGTIDRSVPAGSAGFMSLANSSPVGGPGCMILKNAENKEAAWEFLKWWTSTEIQVSFGRELESLMGPAARYPTANVEALSLLPWSVEEYEKLKNQWEWVKGVPEVPGGYMMGRYLDNAFRQVVYKHRPPRDTLLEYNRLINEEISRKRKEFGLPTTFEELELEWQKLYWLE